MEPSIIVEGSFIHFVGRFALSGVVVIVELIRPTHQRTMQGLVIRAFVLVLFPAARFRIVRTGAFLEYLDLRVPVGAGGAFMMCVFRVVFPKSDHITPAVIACFRVAEKIANLLPDKNLAF